MFIPEYDSTTGNPSYWSFALPGALTSDPVWRILKWAWTGTAGAVLWADGNNNLDNIHDNRASLVYQPNALLSADEAGYYQWEPPSAVPASVFNVGFTIPDEAVVWLNSTPMRRVASFTGAGNEIVVSGMQFTTSGIVTPGLGPGMDWMYLRVPLTGTT